MIKRATARSAAFTFAMLHVVVLVAPAVVLAWRAHKGGLPQFHGLDLVVISATIGLGHAGVVWRRLRRELRVVEFPIDAFIAAFNALVVLAVLATGLLVTILGGLATEHAAIVNHGWPVVGLWAGVLGAAVAASELARSAVLRWLEPEVRSP